MNEQSQNRNVTNIDRDIATIFSTEVGQRVLSYMAERGAKYIRIDQAPRPTLPNNAFMNPNAAIYRAGMEDMVRNLQRSIDRVNKERDDMNLSQQFNEDTNAGKNITKDNF